ncbi:DUF58 domain-containing protein [Acidihalobacter prosperus]|uniref:Uncharacterized protein n=1 Tax=Acidihalobacter prosperus TaxID=160660 RepID=A0A1A6C837_9GAMM|nr:DUF58 domain-containing protein [Acidihalobacter prosperus]OBS10733.1 hypothetical protein Thpro_020449 [Acidihalobacter prosperus]
MAAGSGFLTLSRVARPASHVGIVARWAQRRLRITGQAVTLERRRLFILPTGAGLGYGAMLAVMLLFALNYNNSMIFAATFLLAGIAINAIWQTHRNLLGLRIEAEPPATPLGGLPSQLVLRLGIPDARPRPAIVCQLAEDKHTPHDCDILATTALRIDLPPMRRGRRQIPEIRISTRYPLGLFRAWSLLRFPQPLLVAPAPAPRDLYRPIGTGASAQGARARFGEDDDVFAGLRPYRHGDPPHSIAWRATARSESLLSKQFESETGMHVRWLRWEDTPLLDTETRLSVLCRWVLDADANGAPYGLALPGSEIPPNTGTHHRRQCLEMLALYETGT